MPLIKMKSKFNVHQDRKLRLTSAGTFAVIDKKLYVSVVTLSTQDNTKLQNNQDQDSNKQLTGTSVNEKY